MIITRKLLERGARNKEFLMADDQWREWTGEDQEKYEVSIDVLGLFNKWRRKVDQKRKQKREEKRRSYELAITGNKNDSENDRADQSS